MPPRDRLEIFPQGFLPSSYDTLEEDEHVRSKTKKDTEAAGGVDEVLLEESNSFKWRWNKKWHRGRKRRRRAENGLGEEVEIGEMHGTLAGGSGSTGSGREKG